jgi:hypothetical protein
LDITGLLKQQLISSPPIFRNLHPLMLFIII